MLAPKSPPRSGARTEWKTLLPDDRAKAVFAEARRFLEPDVHAQGETEGGYPVESIYHDTPDLDCFERRAGTALPKYRIRRYGDWSQAVFLEEKLRRGMSVWKRRVLVPAERLASLEVERPDDAEGLRWYRAKLRILQLRPTLLVRYQRRALVGPAGERFTVDSMLEAVPLGGRITFEPLASPVSLPSENVVEVKFEGEATPVVERIFGILQQEATAWSKYRLAVTTVGPGGLRGGLS